MNPLELAALLTRSHPAQEFDPYFDDPTGMGLGPNVVGFGTTDHPLPNTSAAQQQPATPGVVDIDAYDAQRTGPQVLDMDAYAQQNAPIDIDEYDNAKRSLMMSGQDKELLQMGIDPSNVSPLDVALIRAIKGNQSTIPGGLKMSGHEIGQSIPGPMPGTNEAPIRGQVGRVGPERIDEETLDALTPEQRVAYIKRTALASEPVDVTGVGLTTPYQSAKSRAEEAGGRVVLGRSDAAARLADLLERQAAELRTRSEMSRTQEPPQLEGLIALLQRQQQPQKSQDRLLNALAMALGGFGVGAGIASQNTPLEMAKLKEHERQSRSLELERQIQRILAQYQYQQNLDQQNALALEGQAQSMDERAIAARAAEDETIAERNRQLAEEQLGQLQGQHNTLYKTVGPQTVGRPGGIIGLAKTLDDMKVPKDQQAAIIAKAMTEGVGAASEALQSVGPKGTRADIERARFDVSRRVMVPPELGFDVPTAWASQPEIAKKSQEVIANYRIGQGLLDRLDQIVRDGSPVSPDSREEAKIIASELMGPLRTEMGLGVLSESDKELLRPLTGAFAAEFTIFNKEKMMRRLHELSTFATRQQLSKLSKDPQYTEPLTKQIQTRAVK